MKKLNFTFLLTILMSMVGLSTSAHDIAVKNADGVTIYYNYINSSTELAVTYQGSSSSSYNEYTGNVVIPESVTYNEKTYSVTSIGISAFEGCSGLTSVTIPNSVTSIGNWAFRDCSGLTSVTIGNSVTSMGRYAFAYCSGLTSITIPNSVTSIESYAFLGCSGLTSIKVQEGNTKYDSRNNCNAIIETAINTLVSGCKNTIIPNSVTSIADSAFEYCTGLTSITIPNSVTSIEGDAFLGCTGLTSITIPKSVTSIGDAAFYRCSGLTSIKVQEGNTKYDSRNNCNAIIETATNTLVTGCKNTVIPNNVTNIRYGAFEGCSDLTSITIPNGVTSIGNYAFYGCSGLTSITIPNSVTSIGRCAFYACSGLTSITIPNSVTSIGESAFYDCDNLLFVYALSEYPSFVNIGDNSFPMSQSHFKSTLYVKKGLKDLYSQADGWKNFVDIREMTDEQYEELVKKTNGEGETAVKDVSASNINKAKYYSLDGKQFSRPQKGLNILKMSDGATRKVVK